MEKLIIKFPCNDIEVDELKSIVSEYKNVEVVESENKNFDAQIISDIIIDLIKSHEVHDAIQTVATIPAIIIAFLNYKQGVLSNKKVDLYDDEGNIIKLNIRIKDINRVSNIDDRSK